MSQFISALIDPTTLFATGLLVGIGVYLYERRWAMIIIGLSIFQLWFLSLVGVSGFMAYKLEQGFKQYSVELSKIEPSRADLDNNSIDYIFIMGGGNSSFKKASHLSNLFADSSKRLAEGAVLARLFPQAKLVVSGNSGHQYSMALALAELGIGEERIIINRDVPNTQFEIKSIADLQQEGVIKRGARIVIVSSGIHLARIKIWADYYGLFPQYSAASFEGHLDLGPNGLYNTLIALIPKSSAQTVSTRALHEYLGIIYAYFYIRTDGFW